MTFSKLLNQMLNEAPQPPMGGMGGGMPPMGGAGGGMGGMPPMGGGGMPPPMPGGGGMGGGLPPMGGPPGAAGADGQQPPQPAPQIEADNVWDALEQFLKGKPFSDDKDKEEKQSEKEVQPPQQPEPQQGNPV